MRPKDGKFVSLVLPYVNAPAFQLFLGELAAETAGKKVYLVLDNSSWHKAKELEWHHLQPRYLPPYSPDLNVIETLWLYLKDQYIKNWTAKNCIELQDRIIWAIRQLIDEPEKVLSVIKCQNYS